MFSWMDEYTLVERRRYRLVYGLLFAAATALTAALYGASRPEEYIVRTIGECILCGVAMCSLIHGLYLVAIIVNKNSKHKLAGALFSLLTGGVLWLILAPLFLPCYIYNLYRIAKERDKLDM